MACNDVIDLSVLERIRVFDAASQREKPMKSNLALIVAITVALGALPLATGGSLAKGGGGGVNKT